MLEFYEAKEGDVVCYFTSLNNVNRMLDEEPSHLNKTII